MIPNHVFFYSFGKLIFSLCDVLCGITMYQIFKSMGIETKTNLRYTSLWIFNPYVIYLSTRGSADSLECLLVFLTLLLILKDRIAFSALVFGASVHFKIYPIIYSLALFCYCFSKSWKKALRFTLISATVFLSLEILFTAVYGVTFLNETLFHHAQRVDIKHNYSIFFYPFYLLYSMNRNPGVWVWVPHLILFPLISIKLHHDLPLAVFMLTFLFVAFNKVITAQYFNWWMGPLILIAPQSSLSAFQWLRVLILFLAPQSLWNYVAYQLEFNGKNYFVEVWISCLIIFISNVILLLDIMNGHNFALFKCKTD